MTADNSKAAKKMIGMPEAGGGEGSSEYDVKVDVLAKLTQYRTMEPLEKLGGIDSIAKKIHTDTHKGLSAKEAETSFRTRISAFGENRLPSPPPKSFFYYFMQALNDLTLIILIISATISLLLAFLVETEEEHGEGAEWIEGTAILVAVVIVCFVTAINDYSKERQFQKLNAKKEDHEIKVVRNGDERTISIHDLVVGDICILEAGDSVPGDGLFLDGFNLACNESQLTGEPEQVLKSRDKNPFLLYATTVGDGYGRFMVTATGVNTEWGRTVKEMSGPKDQTPLQEKLDKVAVFIGKIGIGAALLTFIALVSKWAWQILHVEDRPVKSDDWVQWVSFFILAVTIIVVAVPEGLPLAVTISLAYSMKKMLADNNLVRHLVACEVMGNATCLCSDKTGTLTENRMSVEECWLGGKYYSKIPEAASTDTPNGSILDLCCIGAGINSKAFIQQTEDGVMTFAGSQTECALLQFANRFGTDYKYVRTAAEEATVGIFTFSSDRKRMSTLIDVEKAAFSPLLRDPASHIMEDGRNVRVYTKGASEIVLARCTRYMNQEGEVVDLTDSIRSDINDTITKMANDALRTIVMAYRDVSTDSDFDDQETIEQDMTFVALCGIKDPVREAVPGAVASCKKAGIRVIMVTGDNINTAKAIARDCAIIEKDEDAESVSIEGPEFRELSEEEATERIRTLKVMARSAPLDKRRLVSLLNKLGEVSACSGDGANDAAALRAASVGLAMGKTGTEVAKEASDIIILDDNFVSIVRAVVWGRCVYDNICKFLQFQLTVNVAALVIAFVGAVGTGESPLTAIQLLWVNLIMDTFAALGLATEGPTDALLDRKPLSRTSPLISGLMWRNILLQTIYQLIVLFGILYFGESIFSINDTLEADRKTHLHTIVFNTFVMCQLGNELNSRKVHNERNIFKNLRTCTIFIVIWLFTMVVQFFLVTFGGVTIETMAIPAIEWIWCILIGMGSMLWYQIFISFIGPFDFLAGKAQAGLFDEEDEAETDVIPKKPQDDKKKLEKAARHSVDKEMA